METSVPMIGTSIDYILECVNQYLMTLVKEQIRPAFEQREKEAMDLRQRTKKESRLPNLTGSSPAANLALKSQPRKTSRPRMLLRSTLKTSAAACHVMTLTGLALNTNYKYKPELKAAMEEA